MGTSTNETEIRSGGTLIEEPPVEMSTRRAFAFGLYFMALSLFLAYLLIKLWPCTLPVADRSEIQFVGTVRLDVYVETRYLAIAMLAGALGSYIHLATSFADFVGNRQLVSSWQWWYLLRPFIGMTLALIMYFVVRGGLIGGSASAQNLSPYGVAAVAGLTGLFSKQATDKLRETFETLFKTDKPPTRADELRK
jgi:hypothetical protein